MSLNGKTILITGGCGSFGQKFTEIVLKKYNPKSIRIYDNRELAEVEMERKFNDSRLRFFIGDVKEVAEGIGYDKRIGKSFLKAGVGYGGSCFPKDINGLIEIADHKKYNSRLLKAVTIVNKSQQKNFVRKIKKILKKINGKTVCILGFAFKPNTDDVRKSPVIKIIKQLYKGNYKIQAYDPVAIENAKRELPRKNIRFCKSAFGAAKNADVLAIVTEWPEFSELDLRKLKQIMKHPYILDGRNIFEPEEMKKLGFYYQGIGRR